MTEQWFLDLDGVRSGPYQTPEVLSLIAEGEVLPHHRISRALKDSAWSTILDWRLEQARQAPPAPLMTEPATPAPEVASFDLPTPALSSEPPAPAPTPPPPPPAVPPPLMAPPTLTLEPQVVIPAPAPVPPAASTPDRPKRDPMAEMYDILQTNKQKREVRQQHQAQAESTREQARTPSGEGSWLKVVLVGAGLALIGFSLGQLFQQSAPPLDQKGDQKSDQKVARTSPTPKLIPSPSPVAETTQVVDRSNPKMTIKAVVPKKPESFRESSAPKETPQNDREMQELKDLKKELQELKAMKDQLRDPGDLEDFEDEVRAAPGPEGGAVYGEPETITPAYPGEGAPRRGRSGVNVSPTPEIHY